MRRLSIYEGLLLYAVALLCTPSFAQNAFQMQLTNLNRAISDRESYIKEKRAADLLASLPSTVRTQFHIEAVTPAPGTVIKRSAQP